MPPSSAATARASLGMIADRRGGHLEVSVDKLHARLKSGGLLDQLPVRSAGTRLRAVCRFSEAAFLAYLGARRSASQAQRAQSVEVLGLVPGQIATVLASVQPSADYAYPEYLAKELARAAAQAIHVTLAERTRVARPSPTGRALRAIEKACFDCEQDYRHLLLWSRRVVARGERQELPAILQVLSARVDERVKPLLDRLAPLVNDPARGVTRANIRVAAIARRLALLFAALVVVEWRLRQGGATAAATTRAPRTRRTLSRHSHPATWTGILARPRVGRSVKLFGRVIAIEFQLRGRKPFSTVQLHRGPALIVPHKDVRRIGWRVGTAVQVTARVVRGAAGYAAEVRFDGPGNHAKTVWEDWLAVVARPAYVRNPESLAAEWSLSGSRAEFPLADLLTRLAP